MNNNRLFSSTKIKEFQQYLKDENYTTLNIVDGDFGKHSITAMQKMIGAYVDGVWGSNTNYYLQKFLEKQGLLQSNNITKQFDSVTQNALLKFINLINKGGDEKEEDIFKTFVDIQSETDAIKSRLANLEFFVLDNSIRETTVGQTTSHTFGDKQRIFQQL